MKTLITKNLGYFAASHNLPYHDGGCYNLHGHNYRVEVTIEGDISTDVDAPYAGMIIDFTHIKDIYKQRIHEVVDHAHMFGKRLPEWYKHYVACYMEVHDCDYNEAQNSINAMLGKVAILNIEQTTAEHISRWVLNEMQTGLREFIENRGSDGQAVPPSIHSVTVYETETSYATTYAN